MNNFPELPLSFDLALEYFTIIATALNAGFIDVSDRSDWAHELFRSDSLATDDDIHTWFENHEFTLLEATRICNQYEVFHFGRPIDDYSLHSVANKLYYIMGEAVIARLSKTSAEATADEKPIDIIKLSEHDSAKLAQYAKRRKAQEHFEIEELFDLLDSFVAEEI